MWLLTVHDKKWGNYEWLFYSEDALKDFVNREKSEEYKFRKIRVFHGM